MNKLSIVGIVLIANLAAPWVKADQDKSQTVIGKFRNTWYYLPSEDAFSGAKTEDVLDMEGNSLVKVTATFKKELAMEGSGKLSDGRVVNYAGKVNKETRYKFVQAPYGLGVGNCELKPLHTIAVDPNKIPYGSLVRIEETVGLVFPDGTVHDGLWRAEDTGSAIVGDRIDLFVGAGKVNGYVLEKMGIDYLVPLTVVLVEAPSQPNCSQASP